MPEPDTVAAIFARHLTGYIGQHTAPMAIKTFAKQALGVTRVVAPAVQPRLLQLRRDEDRAPVVDVTQGVTGRAGDDRAGPDPRVGVVVGQRVVVPDLVEAGHREGALLRGVQEVRDLARVGGLPLVVPERRHEAAPARGGACPAASAR